MEMRPIPINMKNVNVLRLVMIKESMTDMPTYAMTNMAEVLDDNDFSKKLEDLIAKQIRNIQDEVRIGFVFNIYNDRRRINIEVVQVPNDPQDLPRNQWYRFCSADILVAGSPITTEEIAAIKHALVTGFNEILKEILDPTFFEIDTYLVDRRDSTLDPKILGFKIDFSMIFHTGIGTFSVEGDD